MVVDLWAPWCGPCRTLGPILEKVVEATDGAVELVKVNVDENPRISATFQVQSIPAVFALKDRQVVDGFIGACPSRRSPSSSTGLAPAAVRGRRRWSPPGDEASLRGPSSSSPITPAPWWRWPACWSTGVSPTEALELARPHPRDARGRAQVAAEARLAAQQVEVPGRRRRRAARRLLPG